MESWKETLDFRISKMKRKSENIVYDCVFILLYHAKIDRGHMKDFVFY